MADIIIVDSNFTSGAEYIRQYGQMLESALKEYVSILNAVVSVGINDEKISNNISSLLAATKPLSENIKTAIETTAGQMDSFVSAIDEADDFLY